MNLSLKFYVRRVLLAFIKIIGGISLALPFALLPKNNKWKWVPLIELVEGAGHLSGYIGIHPEEYKKVNR
jgi:hypothetical protein